MSFDVFFVCPRSAAGDKGEHDRRVQAAFDEVGAKVRGADWKQVRVASGAEFEWNGSAFLRGLDLEIARALFAIARHTRCVMVAAMTDARSIRVDGLPDPLPFPNMPPPLDVSTPEEVLSYLTGGHEAWRNYREQVVNKR